MFDLPRKVKEFSCMCCGERFWTIEGNVSLLQNELDARKLAKDSISSEHSTITRKN